MKQAAIAATLLLIAGLLSCAQPQSKAPPNPQVIDLHDLHQRLLEDPDTTLADYTGTWLLVKAAGVKSLTQPNTVLVENPLGKDLELHFQKDQQLAGLQEGMNIRALCIAVPKGLITRTLRIEQCQWAPDLQ